MEGPSQTKPQVLKQSSVRPLNKFDGQDQTGFVYACNACNMDVRTIYRCSVCEVCM